MPSPAASTMAETGGVRVVDEVMLREEGSNPQHSAPKADVLPVELSRTVGTVVAHAGSVAPLMGSLIKKRRKRMRKKKHKKMLKRTRWQRRAGK